MIALGGIAKQVAEPYSESDGQADRARRYRRRKHRGLKVFRIELPAWDIISALIERGFLTAEQSQDHAIVSAVLSRYLIRAAVEKFPSRVAAWDIKP